MHWPFKQLKTSRYIKTFPYHDLLKEKNACFGQVAGFESPLWYALDGDKPEFQYSFGYQNWYKSGKYETLQAIYARN